MSLITVAMAAIVSVTVMVATLMMVSVTVVTVAMPPHIAIRRAGGKGQGGSKNQDDR